jgi:hypothetical protein
MPLARAASTTGAKRSMLSAMEQLMLRWLKASLAAPKTTISSGLEGERGLEALHVGRQHRVAHAGLALDARHHLGGVGHLRHPLGRHEAGDLDLLQAGVLQAVHQRDLDRGGHRLLLVLQAVARADVDELDPGVGAWLQYPLGAVNHAGDGFSPLQGADLAGDLRDAFLAQRARRGVRRDRDLRVRPERVVGGQRLGAEHVERGAGQLAFVQQRPAGPRRPGGRRAPR